MTTPFFNSIRRSAVLRAFGIVVAFAGIAKIVGLAKELAIAANFGVGPQIDAYLFVFNVLSAPTSIWFGALFAALSPFLIRLQRADEASARDLRSQFLSISLIVGIVVGGLVTGSLYLFVQQGYSGLSAPAAMYAVQILPLLGLAVPLLFIAHFAALCLMARNRHANSLYEGLPAFFILLGVLFFAADVATLAAATVLGIAAQMAATFWSVARAGDLPAFRLPSLRRWAPFWPAFGVMLGVQTLQSSAPLVDQFYAARLSSGSLATFGYASRLFALFLAMAALALPRVLLPALADLSGDARLVRRFMFRWSLALGGGGFVVATIGCVLSTPLVRIIFERGAFDAADTIAVANVLAIMVWQLPLYMLALLFSQQQYTEGRYGVVAIVSFGTLALKLTLGLWLVVRYGVEGLAASGIAAFLFQAVALYLFSATQRSGRVA